MPPKELKKILESHQLWLDSGGKEGERANFEGAELYCADFHDAVLDQAEFRKANLTEANLQYAVLRGASFEGARLCRANLQNGFFEKADFKNAVLIDANLQDSQFEGASFEGAELEGAEIQNASFYQANFKNADLRRISFQYAYLRDTNFESAHVPRGDLRNATLNGAEFKDANLAGTNLQGAALRQVSFDGADLRGANLREADLQNANLENANFLLTSQLAGADVAGARLPAAIAEFRGLETIAEATSNAQKLFVTMLGGCLYSWLTIGTTRDSALLTNSASSPLPIIGTALPIVGFYMVAPVVLLAMYFYFHLNMQRLWEALADLPAVFPDGRSLDKRSDPWLLNGLVSAHFIRLRHERPSLSRVQQWLSILLAWWVVPVTLFAFWCRFLPRHDWFGTSLHIGLLAVAIGFGWMSYRLACRTLRGAYRRRFRWTEALKHGRTPMRLAGILGTWGVGVGLYFMSFGAIEGIPSEAYWPSILAGYVADPSRNAISDKNLRRLVPRLLEKFGARSFASLSEEDVSTKPAVWTGDPKEYPLVKGARLNDAKMRYASAWRAFLVNSTFENADLSHAVLIEANLSYGNLELADLSYANLSRSSLWRARFPYAKFLYADLRRADLSQANLSNADLAHANLEEANLSNAKLENAGLSETKLSHADFSGADLTGAFLGDADVSEAVFDKTILKRANFGGVTGLTKIQLQTAVTDETTVLPENLP